MKQASGRESSGARKKADPVVETEALREQSWGCWLRGETRREEGRARARCNDEGLLEGPRKVQGGRLRRSPQVRPTAGQAGRPRPHGPRDGRGGGDEQRALGPARQAPGSDSERGRPERGEVQGDHGRPRRSHLSGVAEAQAVALGLQVPPRARLHHQKRAGAGRPRAQRRREHGHLQRPRQVQVRRGEHTQGLWGQRAKASHGHRGPSERPGTSGGGARHGGQEQEQARGHGSEGHLLGRFLVRQPHHALRDREHRRLGKAEKFCLGTHTSENQAELLRAGASENQGRGRAHQGLRQSGVCRHSRPGHPRGRPTLRAKRSHASSEG